MTFFLPFHTEKYIQPQKFLKIVEFILIPQNEFLFLRVGVTPSDGVTRGGPPPPPPPLDATDDILTQQFSRYTTIWSSRLDLPESILSPKQIKQPDYCGGLDFIQRSSTCMQCLSGLSNNYGVCVEPQTQRFQSLTLHYITSHYITLCITHRCKKKLFSRF